MILIIQTVHIKYLIPSILSKQYSVVVKVLKNKPLISETYLLYCNKYKLYTAFLTCIQFRLNILYIPNSIINSINKRLRIKRKYFKEA